MKRATIALLLIYTAAFAQQKDSFTDPRDEKTYKTVKIGKQTWMAENLNYDAEGSKCYGEGGEVEIGYDENGNPIAITLSPNEIQVNCTKYGRLYIADACPKGWHLPSREEWQILVDFAGGNKVAGKRLKFKSDWEEDGNGTDDYGFSALPGGGGSFGLVSDGYWYAGAGSSGSWSGYDCWDEECTESYPSYCTMRHKNEEVYMNTDIDEHNYLSSIRCVKN
jgi:uncharacterized protein (TIGR02145 family)